jgi:hypothetical protein
MPPKSYFGYVEREADSYVNWADVGRTITNTVDEIDRVRTEKKAAIEKAYREDLAFIADNPTGEHETLNAWSLKTANNTAENLKIRNNLLKQGKITVNDYVSFRQNTMDSIDKIYNVTTNLQEAFKLTNDRSKKGENQELERQTKVLLEKYGKLQDTDAIVNSNNGVIYLGLTEMVDEDGKKVRRVKKTSDAYLSPDQLQAAALQQFDNFDANPALDAWADKLGEVKEFLRVQGGETFAGQIISVTDITSGRWKEIADSLPEGQKLSEAQIKIIENYVTGFKDAETKYLRSILGNPYHASALMTEKMRIDPRSKDNALYSIVFDKAEATSTDKLYIEKTPEGKFTPQLSKDQEDDVIEYLRGQLRTKYDRKAETQVYTEPQKPRPVYQQESEGARKARGRENELKSNIEKIKMLRLGNEKQKYDNMDWFKRLPGVDQSRTRYNTDTGEIIVYSKDPEKPEPYIYKINDNTDIDNFVLNLATIAWPEESGEYGTYLERVKGASSTDNPNLDYRTEYQQNEAKIKALERKIGDPLAGDVEGELEILDERQIYLEEKMAAQGQSKGGNKAP